MRVKMLLMAAFVLLTLVDTAEIRAPGLYSGEDELDINDDHVGDVNIAGNEASNRKRAAITNGVRRWENGIVPYNFETEDPDLTPSLTVQERIISYLNIIQSSSCIRFVRWIDWNNDVRNKYNIVHNTTLWFFDKGGTPYSAYGWTNNYKQGIVTYHGLQTMHEVGHALGLAHEIERSDRDHYIQFSWALHQGEKKSTDNLVPFDFSSVMMSSRSGRGVYGKNMFEIYDSDLIWLYDQSEAHKYAPGMSFYDIQALNKAYQCQEQNCPDTTLKCQNEGYIGYVNGACTCVCPYGLAGENCEEISRPDCGGIIDLTISDTGTVSAPTDGDGNYINNQECTWLIKSPEGTEIKVAFTDFNLPCNFKLEIRHHTITTTGAGYCGERFVRSLVSNGNHMMLRLVADGTTTPGGFKADFTKVTTSMFNYDKSNYGVSYAGKVNYTQKYKKCLPWDAVSNCTYYLFLNPKGDNVLGGHNYCRNPSVAEKPWCYAEEDCKLDYCDVAGIGKCYDKDADCAEKIATDGYCDTDEAFERCHLSCNKCGEGVEPKSDGCGTPPTAEYAKLTSTAGSYAEGDIATYTCTTGFGNHTRMCMSDGTWSETSIMCGACPRNWYDDKRDGCYFASESKTNFYEARSACQAFGGDLAVPKDQAEDDALLSVLDALAHWTYKYYIGGGDKETEGVYKWIDGDAVNTETDHFFPEDQQTNPDYKWKDCMTAFKNKDGVYQWELFDCSWPFKYICKVTPTSHLCSDSRSDCAQLLSRTPNMCTIKPKFALLKCKRTCGLCPDDSTDVTY